MESCQYLVHKNNDLKQTLVSVAHTQLHASALISCLYLFSVFEEFAAPFAFLSFMSMFPCVICGIKILFLVRVWVEN